MRVIPSLFLLVLISAAGLVPGQDTPQVPYFGLLENHPDGPEKTVGTNPRENEPLFGLAEIMASHPGFEKVHFPNDVFAFFDKGEPSQHIFVTILEPEKSSRQKMLADPDPVTRQEVRHMVAERLTPVIQDLMAIPGFELDAQQHPRDGGGRRGGGTEHGPGGLHRRGGDRSKDCRAERLPRWSGTG